MGKKRKARPPTTLVNQTQVRQAPIATQITDEDDQVWTRVAPVNEYSLPWKSEKGMNADHTRIGMALPAVVNFYPTPN